MKKTIGKKYVPTFSVRKFYSMKIIGYLGKYIRANTVHQSSRGRCKNSSGFKAGTRRQPRNSPNSGWVTGSWGLKLGGWGWEALKDMR